MLADLHIKGSYILVWQHYRIAGRLIKDYLPNYLFSDILVGQVTEDTIILIFSHRTNTQDNTTKIIIVHQ